MSLVVYGVVRRRSTPVESPGVADTTVNLVDEGELSAAVSEAPDELLARRRDVTAHLDVLDEMMRGGAVLPFRFGTVAADEMDVRRMLTERADEFTAALAALDDQVQLTVHLTHDEDAVVPLVMAANPRLRRWVQSHSALGGLNDRIAVGERVAAEVAAACEADQTRLLDALAEVAEAVAVSSKSSHDLVGSLLVRRDRVSQVDAIAQQAGQTLVGRAQLEVAGPMPPYSFVT